MTEFLIKYRRFVTHLPMMQLGIVLAWVIWAMFYAMHATVDIPTFHIDGTFQTASSLYRLDAGQFPGKDFFPYLGPGLVYCLYPLFKIFGADVSSSIVSAYFTVCVARLLSFAFVVHLVWKPKSFLTSVATVSVVLATMNMLYFAIFHLPAPYLESMFTPGNSLRPLRSFAPYFAALIFYFGIARTTSVTIKYSSAGLLAGILMLWSNDYAISTAGLFGLLILLVAWVKGEMSMRNVLLFILASLLTWVALFTLATWGHPLEMLKYNLAVAHDQWWYFAPYEEKSRIFSFGQLSRLIDLKTAFDLLVLVFLAVQTARVRSFEYALLTWLGVSLFAGGAIASIGGHLDTYFRAFHQFVDLLLICWLVQLGWRSVQVRSDKSMAGSHTRLASIVLLLISLSSMAVTVFEFKSAISAARQDSNKIWVAELGGFLAKEWGDYVSLARTTPHDLLVVEEYWGIWSAIRRTFSNWPVDSVIHAFHNVRTQARDKLIEADMVITTRNITSPEWMPWNFSQNYWLYESLIKGSDINFVSPTTVIWKKIKIERSSERVGCIANKETKSLALTIPKPGFYEIDMGYDVGSTRGRKLLLVRTNINFAVDSDGYLSVDPDGGRVKFPAYFKNRGPASLDLKVIGATQAELDSLSCSASFISFDNKEVMMLPEENAKLRKALEEQQ